MVLFMWCATDVVKLMGKIYENNFFLHALPAATSEKVHGECDKARG